ncbi:MAG: hypothetical protein QW096_12880 [Thermofilaceae archaeon]
MKIRKAVIFFIGPQGSGKTTQALLLKQSLMTHTHFKVHLTESIHYTLITRLWYRLIMALTRRKIRYRFYVDGPIQEFVEPTILRKLFPLDILIHIYSAVLSALKVRMLLLFHDIVIEHEGYILNQIAYIAFIHRKHISPRDVTRKLRMLFSLLPKRSVIIMLHIDYEQLKSRYLKRGSHIEPPYYVEFQSFMYDEVVKCLPRHVIQINANKNVKAVFQDVWTAVSDIIL